MAKYRIVEIEPVSGTLKYSIEKRWLFFFWLPIAYSSNMSTMYERMAELTYKDTQPRKKKTILHEVSS